jgi:hypothetical protein
MTRDEQAVPGCSTANSPLKSMSSKDLKRNQVCRLGQALLERNEQLVIKGYGHMEDNVLLSFFVEEVKMCECLAARDG